MRLAGFVARLLNDYDWHAAATLAQLQQRGIVEWHGSVARVGGARIAPVGVNPRGLFGLAWGGMSKRWYLIERFGAPVSPVPQDPPRHAHVYGDGYAEVYDRNDQLVAVYALLSQAEARRRAQEVDHEPRGSDADDRSPQEG